MPAASLRWNVAISPKALVGSMRNGVYMAMSPYLRLREWDAAPGLALLATAASATFAGRSEVHTSELQSLLRTSYAVLFLTKKNLTTLTTTTSANCVFTLI